MELLYMTLMIIFALLLGIMVGTLAFLVIRLTHLLNAINKRMTYMLVQQNDVLGMFSHKNVGDLEADSDKMKNIIRDMDKPSERDDGYDPFKDGDVT